MTDNEKMTYTVDEAAEQLNISRTYTFQLIGAGELGSIKIGKRRLVSRYDLEDFIQGRRREAA